MKWNESNNDSKIIDLTLLWAASSLHGYVYNPTHTISCLLLLQKPAKSIKSWKLPLVFDLLVTVSYSRAPPVLVKNNTGNLEETWDASRHGSSTKTFFLLHNKKHLLCCCGNNIRETMGEKISLTNSCELYKCFFSFGMWKNADLNGLPVSALFTRSLLGILGNSMHLDEELNWENATE